jgi:hypothetical protein
MVVNHQMTTTMKTRILRFTLLLATVLTLGQSRATEPLFTNTNVAKRSTLERNLDRALNKHLSFPLLDSKDMTGEVYVSFVIDKEGRVEVLDCNSANEDLREYVLRKLARIDIGDNPQGIWRTTHMHITFRPEAS